MSSIERSWPNGPVFNFELFLIFLNEFLTLEGKNEMVRKENICSLDFTAKQLLIRCQQASSFKLKGKCDHGEVENAAGTLVRKANSGSSENIITK